MRSRGLVQKAESRVRRFPLTIFTLLVVVIILARVFAFASASINRRADEQVQQQMREVAFYQKHLAELYLLDRAQACTLQAQALAQQEGAIVGAELYAALEALPRDRACVGLALYAVDTGATVRTGDYGLTDAQKAALAGLPEQLVLPLGDESDDTRICAVAAPIRRNGRIEGYLATFYSTEALRAVLAGNNLGWDGEYFIVSGDGRYALRTGKTSAERPNFLQDDRVVFQGNVTLALVQEDFAAGRSRLVRYHTGDGNEHFGYYTPLGIRDWYLFATVATDVAEVSAQASQQELLLIMLVTAFTLLVVVSVVLYENATHKRALRESSREAVTARKMITRLLSEADCLAFFYTPKPRRVELLNEVDAPDKARLEAELFAPQRAAGIVQADDLARHSRMLMTLGELRTPEPLVLRLRLFPAAPDYRFCKLTFTLAEDQRGEPMFLCAVKDEDSVRREALTLRELSRQDGLTRLYNRRACVELVNEQLARRPQGTFIYLDLDDFKLVNDLQGHIAGDDALITFASAIRTAFYLSDIFARLGGDEFVIFSPYFISRGNAKKHLGRLQQELDKAGDGLAFSAGVAFAHTGDTFEALYRKADQALYAAKNSGKKQFVFFDDL